MITTIRNKFKQTTHRYIMFSLVLIILLSMVSSFFVKIERGESSWAMLVNGVAISSSEFNREVTKQSDYFTQIRSQYGQYADLLFKAMGWSLDPKLRAIDTLVKDEIINQYASKIGFVMHPDYIATIINDAEFVKKNLGHVIPGYAFDQSGMLNVDTINSFLRQRGISAKEFEQSIEKALIQHQIMSDISLISYVPRCDVKQQYIAKNLSKSFSYLTFSFNKFLEMEKKHSVNDNDLVTFYNVQNQQFRRYWIPESRDAITWSFDKKNYSIAISDEEIKEYYDDNKVKSYIKEPLKVEVQIIYFNQLDNPSSESIESIEKDLVGNKSSQWNREWQTVKPFSRGAGGEMEKASFLLQNEGDISSIFETENGPAVVKLVRRIPRIYKPLAEVKGQIKEILSSKVFKKRFVKDIKQIVLGNSDQEITAFISKKSGKKDLVSNIVKNDDRLSKELFSLQEGDYSFYMEGDKGIFVLLSKINKSYLPDLSSIKDVVVGDYREKKAREEIVKSINQAKLDAETKPFDQLHVQLGASLNTITSINSLDEKQINDFEKEEIPVREILNLEKKGSLFAYTGERNSYLFRLDDIEELNEKEFLGSEGDIKLSLEPFRTRLFLDSFVASLRRNATIETNDLILITDEEYSE